MKTFELLKGLVLEESAGGGTSLHEYINLAIQIHCEKYGIDENNFKDKLKNIHNSVWFNFIFTTPEAWREKQKQYEQMIEMLA